MSELLTIDEAAIARETTKAQSMLEAYKHLEITTADEYGYAAEELKAIKGKMKELDDLRKGMTRPLDEAKKRIMDLFRQPTQVLESAEKRLKDGMITFQQEQERIRRAKEDRLRREQEKEAARLAKLAEKAAERGDEAKAEAFQERQALVEAAPVVVAPMVEKVSGIQTRKAWKYRITDEAAIPREYLQVNETLLGNVARATKGTLKIPGVEFYAEDVLASGRM